MNFQPLNDEGHKRITEEHQGVRKYVEKYIKDKPSTTPSPEDHSIDIHRSLEVELNEEVLDNLHFPGETTENLLGDISSALNSGKHIIFTGPPGTGKTEVARQVSKYLAQEYDDIFTDFQVTTATADWSTFDTVGGYMPEEMGGGRLEFTPGQFLRRYKNDGEQINEILVLDEINRADIDKAFGQLFTLLSGQGVQLPFTKEGEEIEILPSDEFDGELKKHQYVVPESWRILATMNTYDKTSLYDMSYAFMRRFSFIRIEAPNIPDDENDRTELVQEYVEVWDGIDPEDEALIGVSNIWYRTNLEVNEREIGPSIIRDMLSFLGNSDSSDLERVLTQSVISYVFPQLEGMPQREQIVYELSKVDQIDSTELKQAASSMLNIDYDE